MAGGALGIISYIDSESDNPGMIELRNVLFEGNTATLDGGAIYATNSVISMTSTVAFYQNSAQQGGAIGFSGSYSKLFLAAPLTANFSENSAVMGGGAIFFQDDISVRMLCINNLTFPGCCFIELSSRVNITLNFNNNNAVTGKILYGGNLDYCTLSVGNGYSYNQIQ